MKSRTIYTCEVCGADYEREEVARVCESLPVPGPLAAVGDVVLIQERYGNGPTEAVVIEDLGVRAPYAAGWAWFHEPGSGLDFYTPLSKHLELFSHYRVVRVDQHLQLSKDNYSDEIYSIMPLTKKGTA